MNNLFGNNDIKKHIEEEKQKAEAEKKNIEVREEKNEFIKENLKKEEKIKNKKNNSKNGIKNLVDLYLKSQGIKYSDWLSEKHQELINEMIEKDILTIKGDKK
ncbi:MAG: hypothetical protein SOR31_04165 [Parvimonas sp.]|uniref:hypothetical protein n=1 Tax=Parvimonas sp. TaxID=1944660 RepID=UPI002A761E04|nr:hypothetical protein [Parvimonas sp.]MDY3050811.1 hypothetical protein [Parvimonas sp.]